MSKPTNKHDGTKTVYEQPGVGILIAVAATTTEAGTVGYAPCCILLTTTTGKQYTNTGTLAAATWTVTGTQT